MVIRNIVKNIFQLKKSTEHLTLFMVCEAQGLVKRMECVRDA